MNQREHDFTVKIREILTKRFKDNADDIFGKSPLLQYINLKTRAANKESKSRSSFANHYAIYVLIEDYLSGDFHKNDQYKHYEGAKFSNLLKRQRELPFGTKLQNHALNHRLNQEFLKYFPTCQQEPVLRDLKSNRYWINENLLNVSVGAQKYNLAEAIKEIIDEYIHAKQNAFNEFIKYCNEIAAIKDDSNERVIEFIKSLIQPNIDARIFEIVSYAILKEYYSGQRIYWGWTPDELNDENLKLYKTGRTNANDGGIDFVMQPLGRFFQVTETIDPEKYFLDIDKVQKYPITFVVKSELSADAIRQKLRSQAELKYRIEKIVDRFMECIEEIINIPTLLEHFIVVLDAGKIKNVVDEIITQSKVEFNIDSDDTE